MGLLNLLGGIAATLLTLRAITALSLVLAWLRAVKSLDQEIFGSLLPRTRLSVTPSHLPLMKRWGAFATVAAALVEMLLGGVSWAVGGLTVIAVGSFFGSLTMPRPGNSYYLVRLLDDVQMRLRIASLFKRPKEVERLETLKDILSNQLPEAKERRRVECARLRKLCAAPPTASFARMVANLDGPTQDRVREKQEQLRKTQFGRILLKGEGPERKECTRRQYAEELRTNYRGHIGQDLGGLPSEQRENALTLLAMGSELEFLLRDNGCESLFAVTFPDDDRSPIQAFD